jgi:mRNA interferase HigB
MRVIAWNSLVAFFTAHPTSKAALTRWHTVVKEADWKSMNDVQATFPKARVLNADRARFEIAGGNFRLIAAFRFQKNGSGIVFVKFIGTHAEYDKVDALTESQF